jgi:hypothetical protein
LNPAPARRRGAGARPLSDAAEADATAEQRIVAVFREDAEIIDNPSGDRRMSGTERASAHLVSGE